MKPALATITLFFFLFLFTISTKSEPVVDISGKKLNAGVSYYVLPALRGKGGGLSFGNFGKDTCPQVVVQATSELNKGKPVQFLPLNPKDRVVYTSKNFNIKFSDNISPCVEYSGVWNITHLISEAVNVGTNGIAGNQDVFNRFMIEKAEFEGVYNLKFCPTNPSPICNDLVVFSVGNDGKRYVGLANPGKFQPLRVVFQKADVKNAINDGATVMSS